MNNPTDDQICSILRQMLDGHVTKKTASIIMDVEALDAQIDQFGFIIGETLIGFEYYSALHAISAVQYNHDKFINPEKIKQCLHILDLEDMMRNT